MSRVSSPRKTHMTNRSRSKSKKSRSPNVQGLSAQVSDSDNISNLDKYQNEVGSITMPKKKSSIGGMVAAGSNIGMRLNSLPQ